MGFNFGARNYKRVKETAYMIYRYAFVIGALETLCFWLFPYQILSLFGSSAGGYEAFALRYMHEFMLLVILLILPRFMGIDGVLITGPIADFLVAVAAFTVVRRAFRQLG